MSETLLQAAAAAAAAAAGGCLRARVFYSSPQARVLFIATGQGGERERGRQQGGERGRQQGGGRQGAERDGGSVQREAGEAPGERGAKPREGRRGWARRRREARGPPAPGPGRCAAPCPPRCRRLAPLPSGPGPGVHCLRSQAAGQRTQSAAALEPVAGGLEAVHPELPGTRAQGRARRPESLRRRLLARRSVGARLGTAGGLRFSFPGLQEPCGWSFLGVTSPELPSSGWKREQP
jgi:hypothetical protein